MTVIGLVLTISRNAADHVRLLQTLKADASLRLGTQVGSWLPLSAETGDPEGLHDRLASLPGVVAVDVTFVEVAQPSAAVA